MAQGIRITIYDPEARESRTLTVVRGPYSGGQPRVGEVARVLEDAISARWRTTRLNSRRHKPR